MTRTVPTATRAPIEKIARRASARHSNPLGSSPIRTLVAGLGLGLLSFAGPRLAPADETPTEPVSSPSPSASADADPERPATPRVVELRAEPSALVLAGARDVRRALVLGRTESGEWIDLSWNAEWRPAPEGKGDGVAVAAGVVSPRWAGAWEVEVAAAGLSLRVPVTVTDLNDPPVGYVRDVQPILSKVGCNSGTCHGGAKGKNGFRLSLRGYDTDFDYAALVDDLSGRRFDRAAPDESLMLLKPTGTVAHEGGAVLRKDSADYALLRRWIAEGVNGEPHAARATGIETIPAAIEVPLPGMTHDVIVLARYADGTTRDVTAEAFVSSNQTEVAKVEGARVKAIRRGEAAVLVRYEGNYATIPMTVMGDRSGFEWVAAPQFNYIDEHVDAKLARMKILPSDLCSDADFARRVHLDLTGAPPSPEAARAFLDDPAPSRDKRLALVDRLIGSPEFTDFWTNKWADLLQCNAERLGEKGVWLFRQWIRDAVATNRPYDKFVGDLLLARGSVYENPAGSYLKALEEPGKTTEDVSQTFLGVRFNCAKCHDHPFEQWTQNQYYEFGAHFARVGRKNGPLPGETILYRSPAGEVEHPKTGMAVAPSVPFGAPPEGAPAGDDRRGERFVSWLVSQENPLFAKAMMNRLWSYFLGRGIIEPVDDIRASNPPSNPELLDALAKDFVEGGHDLRRMMRTICASRVYQSSIRTNRWNEDDSTNFSHARARRLSAEQLLDAISIATGTTPKFKGLPAGMRPVQLADGKVEGGEFLQLFGRPERKSACECERSDGVSLSHALNLVNGGTLGDALAEKGNRIHKLVEGEKDPRKVVEGIFMAVLARPPEERELAAIQLPEDPKERLAAAQDVAWALMNSPAFLFNR